MGFDYIIWKKLMIDKLYKLKQQQINQQLLLKQQVSSKIDDIDKELSETAYKLNHTSIDIMGAISDFRVLEIHKITMKNHIVKLSQEKEKLKKNLEVFNQNIVNLNKESEQFDYILNLQKKEKIKKIQKYEDDVAAEYMQAKFIRQM